MSEGFLKGIPNGAIELGALNAKRYERYKETDPKGFRTVMNYMRGLGINEKTIDFALGCTVGISLMNQFLTEETGKTT